jgi:putative aldouronate transport system substrate-binding protein
MNHDRKNKALAVLAAVLSMGILFAACSIVSNKNHEDANTYPINTDVELTYWVALSTNIKALYGNFGDTPLAKELQKRTGVKLKYIHPVKELQAEEIALMFASNDMPDIMCAEWRVILNGPSNSVDDNIILPLDDLIAEHAPNLSAYIKKNPEAGKSIQTSNGQYYAFPFIRGAEELWFSSGFVMRKDWLDELGLPIPETTEEFENALRRFKNEKGAGAPLTITKGLMARLFHLFQASGKIYAENGIVKFGPCEPEYKEAITALNRWYREGLLDRNYASADTAMVKSSMLSNKSGTAVVQGGSEIGVWLGEIETKNPRFDLVGVPALTKNHSETRRFLTYNKMYPSNSATAISTSCKHPEIAAKYLDYGYSEEGSLLYNFGIEGVSFEWVEGYPKYTGLITNNPDGLSMNKAMAQYMLSVGGGPFVQDKRYIEQYYARPQQKQALTAWSKGWNEVSMDELPMVIYTAEENKEYTEIITLVDEYCSLMTEKFISGLVPLDKYDEFVATLNNMNIQRAIQITQLAHDRYMDR